jgi:hypothetical protein
MGNRRALIPLLAALAVACGAARAAERYDPAEVLHRATRKLAARYRSLPRYICTETVERSYFRPAGWSDIAKPCATILKQRKAPTPDMVLKPFFTDRLRLDVAIADANEIYSWAEASRFEDTGIDKVVTEGPFGTGGFAGLLDVVFLGDPKTFTFEQRLSTDRGELLEYAFHVAREDSHYTVKANDAWAAVAYGGTVQIDPVSGDAVRLRIDTTAMPPGGGCQIDTGAEFGEVPIGPAPLLLATQFQQRFVYSNGNEVENTARLANCREYTAESTVSFGESETPIAAGGNATRLAPRLPADLPFTLELLEPIDTDQAAAGDSFRARLVEPLRDKKGKTLVRGGSIVEGRLLSVTNYHRLPPESTLVMQPRAVWSNGVKVPLQANRDWTPVWKPFASKPKAPRVLMPSPEQAPAGVFDFPGQHVVVKKGFRSQWTTAGPKTKE